MTLSKKIISAAVLVALSSATFAAGVSTSQNIEINVTKAEFVNLLGSVTGTDSTKNLSEAEVNGVTTSIGTLGAEANNGGGCTIAFTSPDNGFKLVHDTDTSLFLHGPTATYSVVHNTAAYATNCNQTASDISVTFPVIPAGIVLAGLYNDTLVVTVTTQ